MNSKKPAVKEQFDPLDLQKTNVVVDSRAGSGDRLSSRELAKLFGATVLAGALVGGIGNRVSEQFDKDMVHSPAHNIVVDFQDSDPGQPVEVRIISRN